MLADTSFFFLVVLKFDGLASHKTRFNDTGGIYFAQRPSKVGTT